MIITQQDIVASALVLLDELAAGELPNANELFDGTGRLNDLLSAWSLIEKHVFVVQNFQGSLSSNIGAYTMGTGATPPGFNTARPVKIESAGVILNGVRSELEVVNSRRWATFKDKAATALVPEVIYNDNDFPLSKLNLWPRPSGTPLLDLYMWGEFASFTQILYTDLAVNGANLNQVSSAAHPFTSADVGNCINVPLQQVSAFTPGRYSIASVNGAIATLNANIGGNGATGGIGTYDQPASYPPGYLKALRYNLAVDLPPEYGRQAALGQANDPASIAGIALSSLGALRMLNASNEAGTVEPPPQAQ
jgi:hypothetical protein